MWPAAPDPAEELAAAAAVRAGAGAGAVRVAVRDVVRAVLAVPAVRAPAGFTQLSPF